MKLPRAIKFITLGMLMAAALFISIPLFAASPAFTAEELGEDPAWKELTGKQRDEVMKKLYGEIQDYRKNITKKAKAQKKNSKTLKQLLKEQDKQFETVWFQLDEEGQVTNRIRVKKEKKKTYSKYKKKYKEKYQKLIAEHLAGNIKDFSTYAGEFSTGDFSRASEMIFNSAAPAFGEVVSDSLGELGYPQSKLVWDTAISDAGTLKKVAIAFSRGKYNEIGKILSAKLESKAKLYSKGLVAGAVNWVFEPVTDKNVGNMYIKLIEYEIAFIEFSKRYLQEEYALPCLNKYAYTYENSSGDKEAAYEEFELCSTVAPAASTFRDFEAYITKSGHSAESVYTPMLEHYRKYRTRPAKWLQNLYADKKKKAASRIKKGLVATHKPLSIITDGFLESVRVRLNNLAWEQMDDKAKDELSSRIAAALDSVRSKFSLLKTRGAKVLAICRSFEDTALNAKNIIARGYALNEKSSGIITNINVAKISCTRQQITNDRLEPLLKRAESVQQVFQDATNTINSSIPVACKEADAVSTTATKEYAGDHLEQCQDAARKAQEAIEIARASLVKLQEIDKEAQARMPSTTPDLADINIQITSLEQRVTTIQDSEAALQAELMKAKSSMAHTLTRSWNAAAILAGLYKEITNRLNPYKNSPDATPGAPQVRQILAESIQIIKSTEQCADNINVAWREGDRLAQVAPLQSSRFELLPSPGVLSRELSELNASCNTVSEDVSASAILQQIETIYQDASAQSREFDTARQSYEKCVAVAIVGYRDRWLRPANKVPNVIGKTLKAASDSIKTAGLNPLIELGEETSEPNNEGIIYRQVPEAGVEVAAGSNVSLLVYNFVVKTGIVPNVIGQQLSTAADTIKETGLTPILKLGNETDDPKKEGTIYSQNPASGTELVAGSDVTLFVYSLTVNAHSVPNVIGKELGIAANIVKQAGFNPILELGDVTKNPKKDGTIYSQAPAPGTEIEAGGDVTLLVYSLIEDLDGVPNVIGKELGEAADAIKQAGFNPLLELGKDTSDSDKDGIIYHQSPAPGTSTEAGSDVTLLVYSYLSEKAIVPNLKGMTLARARQTLRTSGLFVNLNTGKEAPINSDQGMVYKQYPEPGFEVMGGIGIDIWVYEEYGLPQAGKENDPYAQLASSSNKLQPGGVPYIDYPDTLLSHPIEPDTFTHYGAKRTSTGARVLREKGWSRVSSGGSRFESVGYNQKDKILHTSQQVRIYALWLEPGDMVNLDYYKDEPDYKEPWCDANGDVVTKRKEGSRAVYFEIKGKSRKIHVYVYTSLKGISWTPQMESEAKQVALNIFSQIEPYAQFCR